MARFSIWTESRTVKTLKNWKLSHKENALSKHKDHKNTTEVAPLSASNGCFGGPKHCCNFQSSQLLGEDMSTDEDAAKEFPLVILKLIGGGHTLHQNVQF